MQRPWQSIAQSFLARSPARRRALLVTGSLFVLCVLTALTAHLGYVPRIKKSGLSHQQLAELARTEAMESEALSVDRLSTKTSPIGSAIPQSPYASTEPRIAYSAELAVITKNFVRARSSMEETLEKHRGYTARLRMVGQPSGSTLSATLKVPASEYASALADLKAVGNVERDEEAADEVVQQRGDIEARLQNAQNEERRLQLLLKDRDTKMLDPAAIDRKLTDLHNDIVQMELQRHSFDNRVVFSNIHFSLREEHDAPVESISAQLRGAAGAGLSDAVRGLSAILLVLVSYGPSFILWTAVVFFPARYLWRRSQIAPAREAA